MVRFGIFIFDGAEELDWAGPWEVLSYWAQNWPREANAFTVAQSGDAITCAKGLRVMPDHTIAAAPGMDVLIYPGGEGNRVHIGDESIAKWLLGLRDGGAVITSVCTGALVLGSVGLLDGRPATTHWAFLDTLEQMGAGIKVDRAARWVDDGDVITAAGVSAGIDMALHLVHRFGSLERARDVRKSIQYDPEPPV